MNPKRRHWEVYLFSCCHPGANKVVVQESLPSPTYSHRHICKQYVGESLPFKTAYLYKVQYLQIRYLQPLVTSNI